MQRELLVYQGCQNGELEIDPDGRVWRVAKRCGAGKGRSVLISVARKRAEYAHNRGYLFLTRQIGGTTVNALAHRVVWVHFHGPIPEGLTINHKNGDKKCNQPDNLELATHTEQALHALHVIKTRVPMAGERQNKAVLTEVQVLEIRARSQKGERLKDLAAEYGVDASTVSNAVHGKTWLSTARPGFVKTRARPLSPAQVQEIHRLLEGGAKGRAIASRFGVSTACISRMKNGKCANHAKGT